MCNYAIYCTIYQTWLGCLIVEWLIIGGWRFIGHKSENTTSTCTSIVPVPLFLNLVIIPDTLHIEILIYYMKLQKQIVVQHVQWYLTCCNLRQMTWRFLIEKTHQKGISGLVKLQNMNLTSYSENNTHARNPKLQNDLSCISTFTICCQYRLHRMNCALIKSQSWTMHSNILNNKNMKMRYTCQWNNFLS